MLEAQINPNGPDCQLLFLTPRGRLWRERTFYRDLWKPTQEASGLDRSSRNPGSPGGNYAGSLYPC